MDFMLVASSGVAGGVASVILNGLLLNKGFGISKEKSKPLDSISELELGELESLKIEKSILEECISKIYHAYSTNVISKLEYDRLQARYAEEIRICNERLVSLQSTVDLAELHDLKKDLLSLIESKIKMIDEKLNSFSSSSSVLMPDDESLSDYLTIKPREFGTQIKRTIALEHSKIKNVQKEVLDAVADLDKPSNTFTDPEPKETKALENKEEETSSTPNKAKKDALNNLP